MVFIVTYLALKFEKLVPGLSQLASNNPEDRNFYLLRGGSPKSRMVPGFHP
jgi:hypothetical protein